MTKEQEDELLDDIARLPAFSYATKRRGAARSSSRAAHGWAALRWHAQPTRAGWWVLRCQRNWQLILVQKSRYFRCFTALMAGSGYTFKATDLPGEWAGPVKPMQLSRALTPPNDQAEPLGPAGKPFNSEP